MIASLVASLLLAGTDTSGLLVEAPSIPDNRTVAVDTSAGTSAGEVSGFVSGQWQVTRRLSLTAGIAYMEEKASPTAGVRFRLADGLALSARLKSEGFEPEGTEVELAVQGGLSLGKLDLLASATAGYGENTVDLEGAAAIRSSLGRGFDLGVEGRLRSTPDGNKYDLVTGPSLGLALAGGTVRLQAIVGYGANERESGLAAFAGLAVYQ